MYVPPTVANVLLGKNFISTTRILYTGWSSSNLSSSLLEAVLGGRLSVKRKEGKKAVHK